MKKQFLFLLTTLILVAPAAAFRHVFPAPGVNGPTGVVRIPSADIIHYKNYNLAADYGTTIVSGSSSQNGTISYKANLGTFHGVELGIVSGTDPNTYQLREGVFVNMKLSLSSGDQPDPLRLAIGVENLFSYTQTDVYMVATKYLKQGPKLTFGFMADFPNDRFRPLGIAGVEWPLGSSLFLTSDLMLGETLFQTNAGCRFYFMPTLSLNVFGLNVLEGAQVKDQKTILAGLSWANPF